MDNRGTNCLLLHPQSLTGTDFDAWLNGFGNQGLMNAIKQKDNVISIIKDSGLRGYGGSGYPVYAKWELIAKQSATEKYLVCNGNEDEPGTFKDQLLMEEAPFQLIEGATIAALACGISTVIFYINASYQSCIDNVSAALDKWTASSCYRSIAEQVSIDYKIVISPGDYIAGEETAALEFIEGNFPYPRGKPPYPVEKGLHGLPTLVSNIETISYISHILRKGSGWYKSQGKTGYEGMKLFCLSGDVVSSGVYELPMGTKLSELIYIYGNGIASGKSIQAVFAGGIGHNLLTSKECDIALDYETFSKQGAGLGTGTMIVVSNSTNLIDKVQQYVQFLSDSSCGQCTACRSGTFYISRLLAEISHGEKVQSNVGKVLELCGLLAGSGRCQLIDSAVVVTKSALNVCKHQIKNKS